MVTLLMISLSLITAKSWESTISGTLMLLLSMSSKSARTMDWNTISQDLSMNSFSWALSTLSIWIIFLILLNEPSSKKMFQACLFLLLFILLLSFSVKSMMKFYILFELSLFPTFFLILGWGFQPERVKATLYFMLYTVCASLPLLVILMILNKTGLIYFSQIKFSGSEWTFFFSLSCFFAFFVKLPFYFVHLWLIKAHVEAPISGSMILASVLLKLGGYGMVQFSKIILPASEKFMMIMTWSLVGGVAASLMCLRSSDIKILIALSSVAHMSMAATSILTLSSWGLNGAILIMIGHGFGSSGLFCGANMIYLRAGTREFKLLKSLQSFSPGLSLWWFFLVISNMAAPPTINLFGEIHSIIALLIWSKMMMIPVALLTFFACAYSLVLYLKSQHGGKNEISPLKNILMSEKLVLFLHCTPLNFMFLKWSILGIFL